MNIENKTILFADLDGTLITTSSGKTFPEDVTDFRLRKPVLDAIIRLMPNLRHVEIVTNQGGVPQYYSKEELRAKFCAIRDFLFIYLNKDMPFDHSMFARCISVAYQACFSLDKDDPMRKPNTGMLQHLTLYRGESKESMLMIGDASGIHNNVRDDFSDSDLQCAANFGIDYLDVESLICLNPDYEAPDCTNR